MMSGYIKPALAMLIMAGMFMLTPRAGRHIADAEEAPQSLTGDQLQLILEHARFFHPSAGDLEAQAGNLYAVLDNQGRHLGYVVYGPPEDVDIRGFAGPVPFLAGLDVEKRVMGVVILPSRETPGYVKDVADRLKDAWTGMLSSEAVRAPVDNVTGATQTSAALIEGVRVSLGNIEVGEDVPLGVDPLRFDMRCGVRVLMIMFIAFALFMFLKRPTLPYSCLVLRVLSIIIPGFLTGGMLSLALFAGWVRGDVFWHSHGILAVVALLALGIPFFSGRNFYCYHYCPFGAAQDMVGKLSGKLGVKKIKLGWKTARLINVVRFLLLFTAIGIVLADVGFDLSLIEPFAAFHWSYAGWVTRGLAVIFLAITLFVPRPWCRFCPTGAIMESMLKRR